MTNMSTVSYVHEPSFFFSCFYPSFLLLFSRRPSPPLLNYVASYLQERWELGCCFCQKCAPSICEERGEGVGEEERMLEGERCNSMLYSSKWPVYEQATTIKNKSILEWSTLRKLKKYQDSEVTKSAMCYAKRVKKFLSFFQYPSYPSKLIWQRADNL